MQTIQKKPESNSLVFKGNIWPFILITSLFMLWGLANNMTDTLLAAFKRIMSMTDFQTSWIQLAFYGSYFVLALPAAILLMEFRDEGHSIAAELEDDSPEPTHERSPHSLVQER